MMACDQGVQSKGSIAMHGLKGKQIQTAGTER
jgi:hypothetical protein